MASGKDKMLSSANSYIKDITSANEMCNAAANGLTLPLSEVQKNWNGASGTAMAQALECLRSNIKTACTRLTALESQMRTRATGIYNSWPEDEA